LKSTAELFPKWRVLNGNKITTSSDQWMKIDNQINQSMDKRDSHIDKAVKDAAGSLIWIKVQLLVIFKQFFFSCVCRLHGNPADCIIKT